MNLIGFRIRRISDDTWKGREPYYRIQWDSKAKSRIFQTLGACKSSLYGYRRVDPDLSGFEFVAVYEAE
jgi:hypothetical protein